MSKFKNDLKDSFDRAVFGNNPFDKNTKANIMSKIRKSDKRKYNGIIKNSFVSIATFIFIIGTGIYLADLINVEQNLDVHPKQNLSSNNPSGMINNESLPVKPKEIYDIESKEIINENVDVTYPQIINFPGILLMDYMNQDIENTIQSLVDQANEMHITLNLDYAITYMDKNILSILINGESKNNEVSTPILKAINFDLNTSNQINLSNLILPNEIAKNEMDQLFKEAIKNNNAISVTEIQNQMEIYFTKENIVVYFLNSSQGSDYMKFYISLEKAKPYLNKDFGTKPSS